MCFCEFSKPQAACVWIIDCLSGEKRTSYLPAGLAVGVNLPMTDCRSLVCSSSAHLLLLMTVLSPRLSGSESSFVELLRLIKLKQCEGVGSNYKVSCVWALWLILSLLCLREDCRDLLFEIFGTGTKVNIVQYDWLVGNRSSLQNMLLNHYGSPKI